MRNRWRKRVLVVILMFAVLGVATGAAMATPAFSPAPVRTLTGWDAYPWDRIELLRDPFTGITEKYVAPMDDGQIVAGFGTTTPPASDFLLHYAPWWDDPAAVHPVPVLLVHGSGGNANSAWIGTWADGLAMDLSDRGYRVFAVSFASPHGKIEYKAEVLADAIAKLKAATGQEKVDIVAHSMGGLVARYYLEGFSLTPYRGDVRRFVMIGTPNGGVDVTFRHPDKSDFVSTLMPVPSGWIYNYWMGGDVYQDSINSGKYDGTLEMSARWDGVYPFASDEKTRVSYFGGSYYGFIPTWPFWAKLYEGKGVEAAIAQGGYFMARINGHGIPAGVEYGTIAGTNQWFGPFPAETDGPSDGIVFISSVEYLAGLERDGNPITLREQVYANHDAIVFDATTYGIVDGFLGR